MRTRKWVLPPSPAFGPIWDRYGVKWTKWPTVPGWTESWWSSPGMQNLPWAELLARRGPLYSRPQIKESDNITPKE